MATVSVRYITDDTDAAVAFYVERLGFTVEARPGPGFAALFRDDLRLLLNHPGQAARGNRCPTAADGRGGSQVLLDDPAGNPIELFQPADA
jgi:catechol 2,3-dioxygenase-like lactoylglutathione lyase family enzyme